VRRIERDEVRLSSLLEKLQRESARQFRLYHRIADPLKFRLDLIISASHEVRCQTELEDSHLEISVVSAAIRMSPVRRNLFLVNS
jgi:hypothetical protein